MAVTGGYIALHRKILEWEWFSDAVTFRTFVYLLLSANFEPGNYKGREIQRGQLVTSLPKISAELQQTIQQTRTALKHLKLTGEITDEGTPQYRVITIVKYDQYQQPNRPSNRQLTDNQQTDQQTIQHQYNNINNNNKNNNTIPLSRNREKKTFTPPSADEIIDYCENEVLYIGFDAQHFIDYYESNGWMVGKHKMKDWKATVRNWIRRDEQKKIEERRKDYDLPF